MVCDVALGAEFITPDITQLSRRVRELRVDERDSVRFLLISGRYCGLVVHHLLFSG